MARRWRGFVMDSDRVSVPHCKGKQGERFHMAQEVRECPVRMSEGHGPEAAEEFVRGLMPWAQARALGLPEHIPGQQRRHAPGPLKSRSHKTDSGVEVTPPLAEAA